MDGSRKRGGEELFSTAHKKVRPKKPLSNYHFPAVENTEENNEANEGGMDFFINQDGFENDETANHDGMQPVAPEQSPFVSYGPQSAPTTTTDANAVQDSRHIRSTGMYELQSSNSQPTQPVR
jgi:hypothetical protein